MNYPHYVALPFITWSNTFLIFCPVFHSELECRWLRALQALRKPSAGLQEAPFSLIPVAVKERRIIFHVMVKGSIIMISVICKLTLWGTAEHMASAYIDSSLKMMKLASGITNCLPHLQKDNSLKFPHSPPNVRDNCMIYTKTLLINQHKIMQIKSKLFMVAGWVKSVLLLKWMASLKSRTFS